MNTETQTAEQYFNSVLNDDDMVVCYKNLLQHYNKANVADSGIDFLFWACSELNKQIHTKQHAARAILFVQMLAVGVLYKNAYYDADMNGSDAFDAQDEIASFNHDYLITTGMLKSAKFLES